MREPSGRGPWWRVFGIRAVAALNFFSLGLGSTVILAVGFTALANEVSAFLLNDVKFYERLGVNSAVTVAWVTPMLIACGYALFRATRHEVRAVMRNLGREFVERWNNAGRDPLCRLDA